MKGAIIFWPFSPAGAGLLPRYVFLLYVRQLRYFPPNSLVEVTTRTLQNRFLLPPTQHFARIIVGILARAQKRAPIRIHAIGGLSTHIHVLATIDDAEQLSLFMEYANGNIAKEAGRIVDWRDKFWARRYTPLRVSDEEPTQVDRLRYILSHGAKENLVASPRHWPGLHCIDALVAGKPLAGVWYDRSSQYEADRQGRDVDPRAFSTEYQLKLEPLPCWAHLSTDEYRHRIAEMVHDIEAETARRIFLSGKVPLGAEAVRRQNPHERANRPKRSPAPFCHAASKAVREQLREAYRIFVEAYRDAAAQLRAGNRNAQFPEGCFPPALPFIRANNCIQPVRAGP